VSAASARGRYAIAFQPTQTPAHFALVAALAGHPWWPRERMAVLDVGCGRGHAVHVMAAANPGWNVFGLDVDPSSIAEARTVAAHGGLVNAHFIELDLAAIGEGEIASLPPFDVITVHGVWSWVGNDARTGLLRLFQERLAPGGLAYLGTNALPAAAKEAPLQRLLCHLASGTNEQQAEQAIAALRGLEALPLKPSPMLRRLLASPLLLEPAFVAHEFLTPHWRPDFHEDLCAALAPAKLDFLGSCNLFEALPSLYLDPALLDLHNILPAGPARELIKDLALPRSFRADLFVRGVRRSDSLPLLERLVLAAASPLPEEGPVLELGTRRATLHPAHWRTMASELARGPVRLGSLWRALGDAALSPAELLACLVDTDLVLPVFRRAVTCPAADRFNRLLAATYGDGPGHFGLAAPAAAGGVPLRGPGLTEVAHLLEGRQTGLADQGWVAVWRRFGILPEKVGGTA
jgi:SAM-dependent methyltransferase